jgi:hypothetical protein
MRVAFVGSLLYRRWGGLRAAPGLEGVGLAQDVLDGLLDCRRGRISLKMASEPGVATQYLLEWMVSASLSGISMLNSCSPRCQWLHPRFNPLDVEYTPPQ